jgi:regulator of replication initiation timing
VADIPEIQEITENQTLQEESQRLRGQIEEAINEIIYLEDIVHCRSFDKPLPHPNAEDITPLFHIEDPRLSASFPTHTLWPLRSTTPTLPTTEEIIEEYERLQADEERIREYLDNSVNRNRDSPIPITDQDIYDYMHSSTPHPGTLEEEEDSPALSETSADNYIEHPSDPYQDQHHLDPGPEPEYIQFIPHPSEIYSNPNTDGLQDHDR